MKYILAIISIITIGCSGYEPLLTKREDYLGSQLRTSGYYYILTKTDMGYGYNTKVYDCFMLFKNGIYFNVGHGGYNPNLGIDSILIKIDSDVKFQIKNEKNNLNYRPGWGLFNIKGTDIEIERWTSSSGGGTYPRHNIQGKIINDSTINFIIQDRSYPTQYGKNKKKEKIDQAYLFRQFSPKPDSTNKFIK